MEQTGEPYTEAARQIGRTTAPVTTSHVRIGDPPRDWFGRLLTWHQWDEGEGYVAGGNFREHHIEKVSPEAAADSRRRPGWYFTADPDADPFIGVMMSPGPYLGQHLADARRLAEAWLLVPPADRWASNDIPGLLDALTGTATLYTSTGATLTITANHHNHRFLLHASSSEQELRGILTPHFGPTGHIGWYPITLPDDQDQLGRTTWRDACADLAAVL